MSIACMCTQAPLPPTENYYMYPGWTDKKNEGMMETPGEFAEH